MPRDDQRVEDAIVVAIPRLGFRIAFDQRASILIERNR